MSDQIVAPSTRDLDELARELESWVAGRMPGWDDIAVSNLDYPRGAGQSHETILFDLAWREGGERKSRGLVVRIKPTSFTVYPDDLFEEQYRAMQAYNADGRVRVAEPLWFESDPALLGAPFFVMEKKSGRVPVSIPPYRQEGWLAEASPDQRRKVWENGVRQLAEIQNVPTDDFGFLAGPDGLTGFEQEWDKYVRFVDWVLQDVPSKALSAGLERLARSFPDNRAEGLVWGDARIGNMMFDENFEVVTVMDWEQVSLGGALHDLAWFTVVSETMHGARDGQPRLEGMGTRDETARLWEEICGKSAADLEWYEDFTHLKMTCLALRMGHMRNKRIMDEAAIAKRLKVA